MISYKNLRKELLKLKEKDQKLARRNIWDKKTENFNKMAIKRMKEIVKRYGWPTISMVGKDGAEAAWLLVQHADRDVKFQKNCLELMRKASRKGEAELKYLAYLTDRVRVNSKKLQLYGTQFYHNKKGRFTFRPIENRKHLEKRRRKMGLGSFSKYMKGMKKYHEKCTLCFK